MCRAGQISPARDPVRDKDRIVSGEAESIPETGVSGRIPSGPAEKYDSSQDLLRWMSEQFDRFGDIYKASIYGANVYVTREPEHAEHVLRVNWQNYTKGQTIKRVALLLGNGLMTSEGEFWKSQRRMIQPAFHRTAIEALCTTIKDANVALLKKWEEAARRGDTVNVTRDVSSMVLEVVLRSIFGVDYPQVAQHFKILSEENARNLEFAQLFRSLEKIIFELATQRRERKKSEPDILGILIEARDQKTGKAMPDRQLVNEIKTLIVAGHETTTSTLCWTWYLLAQDPAVEEKLSIELEKLSGIESPKLDELPKFHYARQIIDEAMRLYPPGWLMTRKAHKDDQLGKYFVPAGTEIYISPYFIQRNPKLWDEPDRFNPDRFSPGQSLDRRPMAMIPFSAGPRNCIGEVFARVEMQIHVVTIARRLRLRSTETKSPELDVGVNLRAKHDLFMKPQLKAAAG
jgi:cytochrome P450